MLISYNKLLIKIYLIFIFILFGPVSYFHFLIFDGPFVPLSSILKSQTPALYFHYFTFFLQNFIFIFIFSLFIFLFLFGTFCKRSFTCAWKIVRKFIWVWAASAIRRDVVCCQPSSVLPLLKSGRYNKWRIIFIDGTFRFNHTVHSLHKYV